MKPRRQPLASLWARWHFRLDHMPPGPERTILRGLLNEVDEAMADNITAGLDSVQAELGAPPSTGSATPTSPTTNSNEEG